MLTGTSERRRKLHRYRWLTLNEHMRDRRFILNAAQNLSPTFHLPF
jgi:hypothetical protein